MRKSVLAGSLAFVMLGAQAQQQAGQPSAQELAQQAIPDAPKPQTALPNAGSITPGKGTPVDTPSAALPDSPASQVPVASSDAKEAQAAIDQAPPTESLEKFQTINVRVNYVDIPFTVKDSKGNLVAGLTSHDVLVYENNLLQHIAHFTTDPFPLSVALVIDQSLTSDEMGRVNSSLGAVQGAFTKYDSIAVFTYNNGPKMQTDFTGAESARLTQAIELSKGTGREPYLVNGGPLACTTCVNGENVDPNTAAVRNHTGIELNPPKEVHTLNDAILAAATALSKTDPWQRRRLIYVISDGKEYGSKAKFKEVVQYLNTNKIAVYGTLVGDSAVMGLGFLDRIHLPLLMRDNVLPAYANATGGNFDAEFRTGGIEKSFAKIASEVRNQYTLGYYTHEDFIDGKYRKIDVHVLHYGKNLTVLAKDGYYPAAEGVRPHVAGPAQ